MRNNPLKIGGRGRAEDWGEKNGNVDRRNNNYKMMMLKSPILEIGIYSLGSNL